MYRHIIRELNVVLTACLYYAKPPTSRLNPTSLCSTTTRVDHDAKETVGRRSGNVLGSHITADWVSDTWKVQTWFWCMVKSHANWAAIWCRGRHFCHHLVQTPSFVLQVREKTTCVLQFGANAVMCAAIWCNILWFSMQFGANHERIRHIRVNDSRKMHI